MITEENKQDLVENFKRLILDDNIKNIKISKTPKSGTIKSDNLLTLGKIGVVGHIITLDISYNHIK